MRRFVDILVVVACLAIVIHAAASPSLRAIPEKLAKRWKKPPPPAVKGYSPRIEFPDLDGPLLVSPTPGRVDVHASIEWQDSSASYPRWEVPFIEVGRFGPYHPERDDEEWEEVFSWHYFDRAWESLPGRVHRHEFRETLQLPPGQYSIRWGNHSYDPAADGSGMRVPTPFYSTRSFRAIVH
jgi:hypothetical protein